MTFLKVDETKCKKDGICANECPMVIIRMQDGETYPEMVPGGEQACLVCGHCVAVCPHGAMSHVRVPVENSPLIEKDLVISQDQAIQFLRSRRSIRHFKDQPVSKEDIQRLIEIARYAPTGGNTQMVSWIVCTDQDLIRQYAEMTTEWMRKALAEYPDRVPPYFSIIVGAWDMGFDAVLRKTPALIVAHAPAEASNGMVDLTLGLSYLELAAPTMGLGTCWAGLLQGALQSYPELKQAVGIPADHPHHYPMMLGHTKFKYYRLPERKAPNITWK